MKYYTLNVQYFAANFSCGAYGAGNYDEGQDCTTVTTTTGSSGGSAGGGLADTGVQVVMPLTLGALLIAAAVVLFIRRPKKQTK